VHAFDPGVPYETRKNEQALTENASTPISAGRVTLCCNDVAGDLENSGQWGAVRVCPENVQFMMCQYQANVESTERSLL